MSRTFGVTLHGTEYMVTVREIPTPQEDITATDSTGDIDSGYTEGTVLQVYPSGQKSHLFGSTKAKSSIDNPST